MKKNIVLIALSVLSSFSHNLHARKSRATRAAERGAAQKVCKNAECTMPNCQCYCSVKCGPRDIKPGDSPRCNKETGKCMCADRDEVLYGPNNCAEVDAQKEAESAA